jgi:hypothetical protein
MLICISYYLGYYADRRRGGSQALGASRAVKAVDLSSQDSNSDPLPRSAP